MPYNSSKVFLLTIRLLVIHILPKAVGRNLVQRRKSNQSKSLLFCLCVFFPEPTNAKRSVIGRSASVPWSWSALRRPHQLRELSQTQPFFVSSYFHFSFHFSSGVRLFIVKECVIVGILGLMQKCDVKANISFHYGFEMKVL